MEKFKRPRSPKWVAIILREVDLLPILFMSGKCIPSTINLKIMAPFMTSFHVMTMSKKKE